MEFGACIMGTSISKVPQKSIDQEKVWPVCDFHCCSQSLALLDNR